jgi:hypothetical protein
MEVWGHEAECIRLLEIDLLYGTCCVETLLGVVRFTHSATAQSLV